MEGVIRVLLVEDNPGDARLVQVTLADEPGGPFQLERVGRITDALRRLERPAVDVVLLDRWLPDGNGWGGLLEIRKKAPHVPVIVLTGSVDPRLAQEATEMGAQDYRMKGIFGKGILGAAVTSALTRHRTEERLAEGRELDERDLAALRALPEGAAVFEGRRMLFANEALELLSGCPEEELQSVPAWMPLFVTRQQMAPNEAPLDGAPAPAEMERGAFVLRRNDGSTLNVEYVAKAYPFPSGRRAFVWLREALAAESPSDPILTGLGGSRPP